MDRVGLDVYGRNGKICRKKRSTSFGIRRDYLTKF
jgi:hypothetical protein